MWRGAHPNNYDDGRAGVSPHVIVIHTADGSFQGTRAWFGNPSALVSAHYGISLTGQIDQYVRERDTAYSNGILDWPNRWPWAGQGNPNLRTISIETEDRGEPEIEPVTTAQFNATEALCRDIMGRWGTTHLAGHRAISHRSCPGMRWVESGRLSALAQRLQLPLII